MEQLLKDRVCVVTGGSRGIGRSIALACAKQGASVIITYLSNRTAAEETVAAIEESGGKGRCIQSDAGNEDDVKRLRDILLKEYGNIHILINNAGTIGKECPTAELSSEEWDRVFRTDVKGVFLNIKYLIPLFDPEKVGKIINISSELSIKGRANYLHYTAAKGAINAMTRSLALELAPGILVNTVAPGPIETDMILKDMNPEWIEREKDIPLRRLGTVSEISATVVLLASDYGNFYCGQFLSPNGGAVFI